MGLRIDHHIWIHQENETVLTKLIKEILTQTNQIMSKTSDIEAKVDALQGTLDAEQEQIRNAISELEGLRTEVQALRDQLASQGVDNEALDRISTKLDTITEDLKGTIADAPTEEPIP